MFSGLPLWDYLDNKKLVICLVMNYLVRLSANM